MHSTPKGHLFVEKLGLSIAPKTLLTRWLQWKSDQQFSPRRTTALPPEAPAHYRHQGWLQASSNKPTVPVITAVSIIRVDAVIVKQINLLRCRQPRLYSVSPCARIASSIFFRFHYQRDQQQFHRNPLNHRHASQHVRIEAPLQFVGLELISS